MKLRIALATVGLALFTAGVGAQDAIDPALLADINRIRAIDNHTHADAVDAARSGRWNPQNPLGTSRYPDVVPLARDHPDWRLAWQGLYGYSQPDAELPHLQALLATKRKALADAGNAWPAKVLDAAGIDVALVNAVRLGPGLGNARFRWVPYGDPLMYPFSPDSAKRLYSGGDVNLASLLAEAGVNALPPTRPAYRQQVIEPTLARWKQQGAVAVKFLTAYQRSLNLECPDDESADSAYRAAIEKKSAGSFSRELLEGAIFCDIAAVAGNHGLAVHIHTGNGDGPYFNNHHANPGQLENALNHRSLRKTNFVLVHGGWPYHLVAQAMLDKPNTYADFSAQTFYLTTHALAEVLRGWLSWHPEKVMFGSDAYSDVDSPLVDWEEKQWLTMYKARRALAIALTAMMRNDEISRERAIEIARMVLRDNAAKLYGIRN